LAVAGAVFIGTVGAVAFAGPASAWSPIVEATVKCTDTPDVAVVIWKVSHDQEETATLKKVRPKVGAIDNGTKIKKGESVTGEQEVNLTEVTEATLSFEMHWDSDKAEFTKTVDLTGEDCAPKPGFEIGFVDNCDGSVLVKLHNSGEKAIEFRVNGSGEWNQHVTVEPGKHAEVTAPAGHVSPVRVKVGDEIVDKHTWKKPSDCGVPVLAHRSDCDNLTITVANPADGKTVKAVAKVGDEEIATEVAPGETKELVLPGTAGLVALVTVGDKTTEVKYEEPANCNPGLPVTGVNAGLLAGAALVLVSGGAGLFFVARRRRIRFAA
jgi:hypothetical protein